MYLHFTMIITGSTKKQYHFMRRDPNSFVQDSAGKTCSGKVFPKNPTRTCKQFVTCSLAELRHSQIEMTAGHGFMEPSKAHTAQLGACIPLQTYLLEFYSSLHRPSV